MYNSNMNILIWLLVWIGPILSFIANNIEWFTSRQIIFSIGLSSFFGILFAGITCFLPDLISSFLPFFIFCILIEKLINLFISKIKTKIIFVLLISTLFSVINLFFGLYPLCIILVIYTCFALKDLYKNYKKPKNTVVLASKPNSKTIPLVDDNGKPIPKFDNKHNIYILFLESLHSKKALQELYNIDDMGLSEFLEENQFRVFSRSCSNIFTTKYSLNTILNMKSESWVEFEEAPLAFRWLKALGYEINLIDCGLYAFSHYIPWCDYFNFSMPNWVEKIYEYFLPFFLQSSVLNKFTKDYDPFTDSADFGSIYKSFLNRLHRKYKSLCFYIVRFGIFHIDFKASNWRERKVFCERYINQYQKTVPHIKTVITDILSNDPNSYIVVVGDHGAGSWIRSWVGKGEFNDNMRKNGVEPATVAQDLTGILFAIHLPDGKLLEDKAITPSNIFPILLKHSGVSDEYLPDPVTNFSYYDLDNEAFLIAKDCEGLKNWEIYTHSARLVRKILNNEDVYISSINDVIDISELLSRSGKFQEVTDILERGLNRFHSEKLIIKLAEQYIRIGYAKKCFPLLEKYIVSNQEALILFVKSLAVTGQAKQAIKLLDIIPSAKMIPEHKLLSLKSKFCTLCCEYEQAIIYYKKLIDVSQNNSDTCFNNGQNVIDLALLIDSQGRTSEALDIIDKYCLNLRSCFPFMMHIALASLSMRNDDYQNAISIIEKMLNKYRSQIFPYFYLWKSGILEQQGHIDNALETLLKVRNSQQITNLFLSQIGLFLIRNKITNSNLINEKKEGYNYLRTKRDVFDLIFDSEWYSNRYSKLLSSSKMDPLTHFIHYGRVLALDPNPLYNQIFYLVKNYDVFCYGFDALCHFLICSPYENRDPSVLFSNVKYPNIDWSHMNPLVYYIQNNRKVGEI